MRKSKFSESQIVGILKDANTDGDGVIHRQRAALEALVQGLTVQQFEDKEQLPIGLADIVDGANVGVLQRRDRARFPAEPLPGLARSG